MVNKPTYEQLEQRIRELEEKAVRRKETEEALRESEEHYRTAIEHSNDGIAIVRGDNYLYANKKFAEIFGYDGPKEIVGRPISMTIHPEDQEWVTEFNHLRQQGKPAPSTYDCKGIRRNGKAIYLEVSATKSIFRGEPVSLVFFRDTTNRKEREEALKEHEEQYRDLFENAPLGLGIGDEYGNIIDFNDAMLRPGGYTREDIAGIGNMAGIFYAQDERNRIFAMARREGFIDQAEVRFKRKDGTPYDALLSLRLIQIKGKPCWQAMIQDITERKLAEERIHTLSQELLKAQENKSQRISRYLHDHVAQDLSTLKIGCETLFDDYPDAPPEKKKRLSELSEIIQGTITSVRGLAYDLRPPGLDQLGLIQSVFQYCEDFSENTGLSVDFKAAGMDGLRVDPDIEINLYRLVQEGLNNIKKHAEADHVIVRLVASFPKIILRIEDDGKGFDVEGRLLRASKEKRMGIGSMEERVNLLNGNLKIRSRLMEGTKIFIEIPFKEKKNG